MSRQPISLKVDIERWPLAQAFVISRGAKTEAEVIVVALERDGITGRGEAVPYARYGESAEGVATTLRGLDVPADRRALQGILPAGAARNALDCAFWDLEAKTSGVPAAGIAGRQSSEKVLTAYTISLGAPDAMAVAATRAIGLPLLKLKLGGVGDIERIAAVRAARPDAQLICDANEAWTPQMLSGHLQAAYEAGVELIEQPLPSGRDSALEHEPNRRVPICADESAHTADDLASLVGRYDAVNIKLDKTGGLTHAIEMADRAKALDLKVMLGSMVATSLSVAPALIIAGEADWVDLDGPLLLARDRNDGITVTNGCLSAPPRTLWG